jgi:hypothetical protein
MGVEVRGGSIDIYRICEEAGDGKVCSVSWRAAGKTGIEVGVADDVPVWVVAARVCHLEP